MKIAVYPGSFDPVTNGHLDIIARAAKIFDKVVVAVLKNSAKTPAFSMGERTRMLMNVTAHLPNVEIDSFEGLLVDYARYKSAGVIIKGLRAVSDFEYELQMALMNQKQDARIETLFMMTSSDNLFLSSSIVKEVARLGGKLSGMVPPQIEREIYHKFGGVKEE